MDYLEFFGLKEDPFRLTPDPSYFYPSESHNEALSSFNYIVEQKEGFFMCIGEPGTGKTTLLNTFLNTGRDKWKDGASIALVLTPRLSPEEFLLTVLEDLNVKVKNTNKNEIIKAFRDFLIANSMSGRRVIIIVDEAQNLPDETLEEVRLLSNLETEKEKLLQIVLIGQPELRSRLLSENLKQLNQRISVRATLRPLTMNETSDYINYRMVKAGRGTAVFEEKTKRLIHKLSKGIPRLINLISSRAMMAAYLDMSRSIKKRHVKYALKHVSDSLIKNTKGIMRLKRATVFFLLSCIIAASFVAGKDLIVKKTSNTGIGDGQRNYNIESKAQEVSSTTQAESIAIPSRTITVTVDIARLRAKPSLDSKIVGLASKGAVFEIVDEHTEATGEKWYKVKTDSNQECWIADKTVIVVNE